VIAPLFAVALAPSVADADPPESEHLVLAGAGMAVPTFFLGTFLHEGSHAAIASAFGAEITRFVMWPSRHPVTRTFYFGYVEYRGRLTPAERALFLVAPKLTNIALFSGYAALVATETLPSNRYGQLALAVFATGLWVDFSKDVFAFRRQNDMVRFYSLAGLRSEGARLPLRLANAALSVAGAFLLYRAYEDVFADDDAVSPLVTPLVGFQF
jgi:hypothetical protein